MEKVNVGSKNVDKKKENLATLDKPIPTGNATVTLTAEDIVGEDSLTPRQKKLLAKNKGKKTDEALIEELRAAAATINPVQERIERQTVEAIIEMGKKVAEVLTGKNEGQVQRVWEKAGFRFGYGTAINYRNCYQYKEAVLKDRDWFLNNLGGQEYSLTNAYAAAREAMPPEKKREVKKKAVAAASEAKKRAILIVTSDDPARVEELLSLATDSGNEAIGLFPEQLTDATKLVPFLDSVNAYAPRNA